MRMFQAEPTDGLSICSTYLMQLRHCADKYPPNGYSQLGATSDTFHIKRKYVQPPPVRKMKERTQQLPKLANKLNEKEIRGAEKIN